MAKILLWNVPVEYRQALETEARRLAPEVEIDDALDEDVISTGMKAVHDDEPYTQIVVFIPQNDTPEFVSRIKTKAELLTTYNGADLLYIPESLPLEAVIAEFNRTFHPWKK